MVAKPHDMDTTLEMAALLNRMDRVENSTPENLLCICIFSDALDRQLAALTIATGAAATGMRVKLFYTFWATCSLRSPRRRSSKSILGRMFGWMLPSGSRKLKLSKLQMMGMGPVLIRRLMKKRGAASIEDLLELAADLGVEIGICSMTMELMEFNTEELIDYPGLGCCGVATFISDSSKAKTTLFI